MLFYPVKLHPHVAVLFYLELLIQSFGKIPTIGTTNFLLKLETVNLLSHMHTL